MGFFMLKQFGRGYGDGRICKILAGEFKSHVSHKMFRSSSGRTSPFQGEGHGFESRTEYKINWKVGEWLKPADCKSVLFEYGGSNPSLPTQVVSGLLVIKIHRVIHEKNQFWSVRLAV